MNTNSMDTSQNGAHKSLLIIIDGLRPDAVAQVDTPHIDRIAQNGAYTWNAKTVSPSITLPAHFSIFTSLTPGNHGVVTNMGTPPVSKAALSLFSLIHYAGKKASAFYNWEYLRELSPPGCLSAAAFFDNAPDAEGDLEVAEAAVRHIVRQHPDFCFIYLGCLDHFGHESGFMSDAYLKALTRADRAVGVILEAIDNHNGMWNYNVILHSDHGGHDRDHAEDRKENTTIPWLAAGPDIERIQEIQTPVSILDTTPTLARLLGLAPHPAWQGKAVSSVIKLS